MSAADGFMQGAVTSRDGTRIGFRRIGRGPSLVLVQGAMGTARNYDELARGLASGSTVYLPDRRGRGMSPKPYTAEHRIARDVEDIDVVLAEAQASQVFGLSSGAMIVLEAARTLPRITRAAVYEPPFYAGGVPSDRIARFNAEVEAGDLASALVTAGGIVGLSPLPVRLLPKRFARLFAGALIRRDGKRSSGYAPFCGLIPAMRYDFAVVAEMDSRIEELRRLSKPMLLLSGDKSPAYLRQAARTVTNMLGDAQHVELAGLDHSGAWNKDRGGHPEIVAEALRSFFG